MGPAFMTGVDRLSQLLGIRHANIILGEPSCGKTSVWRLMVAKTGIQAAESQGKMPLAAVKYIQ